MISDINPLPPHYYCHRSHYIDFKVDALDGFDLSNQACPVCGCPLKSDGHNIPFETLMGYYGNKTPDLALNVPASKQYSELAFMQELFGTDKVAHAGTIATLREKLAEGYISDYEVKTGDHFTKERRSYIYEKICGVKWRDRICPGSVIVLPQEMTFEDITPLKEAQSPSPIKKAMHFDYHSVHDTIIKLDALGHPVPDMLKLLEEFTGVSIQNVVWNDPEMYALFSRADTLGIWEFDTDFMKDMLLKLKPKSFHDLVQIWGLSYGTGIWIDNCDQLLYDSHLLSELPALRDDIFLQLMQYGLEKSSSFRIAECVRKGALCHNANWTLELVERMRNNNVPEWYIQSLRKVRYLSPKAHETAYAMNAVRMAWYKIYYPTELYAAYLSCCFPGGEPIVRINDLSIFPEDDQSDNRYFLEVIDTCSQQGIQLLKPDSEKSHCVNYLPERGNIRMPAVT